jgi:uncharacterized membrane protein YgdD (TMEM256/DUF423 family)
MPHSARTLLLAGALLMVLAVACGAFAAHGLRGRLEPEQLALWQTAVDYHVYHALGVLAVGLLALRLRAALLRWSGWAMLAGIALFSGSLYALALGAPRWLGAVTPVGGTLFILGWALLAASIMQDRSTPPEQP